MDTRLICCVTLQLLLEKVRTETLHHIRRWPSQLNTPKHHRCRENGYPVFCSPRAPAPFKQSSSTGNSLPRIMYRTSRLASHSTHCSATPSHLIRLLPFLCMHKAGAVCIRLAGSRSCCPPASGRQGLLVCHGRRLCCRGIRLCGRCCGAATTGRLTRG